MALWRGPQRWQGVPLLVWGLLGTAMGIAVGVRHALAGEVGVTAVACCLALVAGLYLLGSGTGRLLRGLHWAGKVAGSVAVVVGTVVGLYVLVVPLLATQPLRGPVPANAAGFENVTFPASDGVTLSGWYAAGGNGAAVVVVPGSGSSRTGAVAQAETLAVAGYAVLVYDPRGHGASEGRAMDLGWAGDPDVRGAVDFLTARAEVPEVGALGLSMGGEQVLGAAAADRRIAAVVAEGTSNRVAGDLEWLSAEYGVRGRVQVGLEHAQQAVTAGLAPYPAPITLRDAIAAISPRPVLLITAGTRPDEGLAARFNAAGTPQVQIWEVPGAGHTGALTADRDGWQDRVVGFFDETLKAE
jgi:pimeloyl-ACP methyl ester carboxylesterase